MTEEQYELDFDESETDVEITVVPKNGLISEVVITVPVDPESAQSK